MSQQYTNKINQIYYRKTANNYKLSPPLTPKKKTNYIFFTKKAQKTTGTNKVMQNAKRHKSFKILLVCKKRFAVQEMFLVTPYIIHKKGKKEKREAK